MRSIFLYFCVFTCLYNCKAQNTPLYVGTYTNDESEGIYQLQFNSETGELSDKKLAIATQNPSFITFSPDKKHMYAVGEGSISGVTSFKLKKDGTLKLLNTVSSNGKGPCHVSVNQSGDKAVVSNYGGGTVSIYTINNNGSINEASQIFNHNTTDKPARAHSAQFFDENLYVADLGNNAIYQYQLKDDTYNLANPAIVETTDNPGPRHFALTKDGHYIYIINEYGSSITSVKKTDIGFEQIDYDSTLDDHYEGKNSCADIHLSKDEKFLYGSNRGENTIAVFKRNPLDGTIEKIQNITVHGDWPRNFTLDPTGKFLLVANKKSHNISVFSIDSLTGKLTFLNDTKVPSPVCLLF
jgi:6-phosphogluconolactonase